jgi:hypothetical protein
MIINTLAVILLFSGCGSSKAVAPSQNSALNSISKSNASKEKDGWMQKSLDGWLKNDWEPTVTQDKEIQKKYMEKRSIESQKSDISISNNEIYNSNTKKKVEKVEYIEKKDKPFTLQEYVDKAEAYMKAKPNDYEHSNVKKVESLPVIGK